MVMKKLGRVPVVCQTTASGAVVRGGADEKREKGEKSDGVHAERSLGGIGCISLVLDKVGRKDSIDTSECKRKSSDRGRSMEIDRFVGISSIVVATFLIPRCRRGKRGCPLRIVRRGVSGRSHRVNRFNPFFDQALF